MFTQTDDKRGTEDYLKFSTEKKIIKQFVSHSLLLFELYLVQVLPGQ